MGGYSGIGAFSGNFLRNDTGGNPAAATTLTLNGLPSHSSVGLSFLLAMIDSWDGDDSTWGPDFFNVKVDGVPIFNETVAFYANQYNPGTDQSYHPLSQVILSEDPIAYDMKFDPAFTFPHSANTLTIEWFASGGGWQGDDDESWAIDNVEVILDPEPIVDPDTSAPIPTMSGWALITLSLMLVLMVFTNRKRLF